MSEKHFVQQITIDEQIAQVKREISLRRKVYAKWVEAGSLPKARADFQILAMEAVLISLQTLAKETAPQTGLFECQRTADSITTLNELSGIYGDGRNAKKSFTGSEKAMNFQTNSCYREKEKILIVETLLASHSLLLVGKAGIGTSTFLKFVAKELARSGANLVRIAPDTKKHILVNMAYQLSLYAEDDKLPTSPRLQKEVTDALKRQKSIIVIDEANRLSVSVRAWLEELHENGQVLFLGTKPAPVRDLFLKLPRMELKPLSYEYIRKLIIDTAEELQIEVTPADMANLQSRCAGNLMLARRVVREHQIGLKPNQHDHTEWINGTPFLIGALICLTMIRFIERGIGDTNLYIIYILLAVAVSLVRLLMFSLPKGSSKLRG